MKQNFPARGVDSRFTLNDTATMPSVDVGRLSEILSWQAARVRAITGEASWRAAVPITLSALASHRGRHSPGGADPLLTAAPSGGLGAANTEGTATSFSRADHQHLAFDNINPASLAANPAPGTAIIAARRDHVHARSTAAEIGAPTTAEFSTLNDMTLRFMRDWHARDLTGPVGGVITDTAAIVGQARQATVATHVAGYLIESGTNCRTLRAGRYTSAFRLRSSNNTTTSVVAALEVFMEVSGVTLATLNLRGVDFTAGVNTYQVFYLPFNLQSYPATGNGLQFRVHFRDVADITVDSITVRPDWPMQRMLYNSGVRYF